jgi:tyrosine-protein kinase Etk/Wzc
MAIDTRIPNVEHEAEAPEPSLARYGQPDREMSLLDILIALAERKRQILAFIMICGVAGLLVSLILPKRYTAIATVLPPQRNSSLGASFAAQLSGSIGAVAALAGGDQSFFKDPNDMYISMFQSRTVEEAMIQRFGLMQEYRQKLLSHARKTFDSNFKVEGDKKDGFLHISVIDKDPKRAAEMANGWIEEFRKLSKTLAIGEAAQRRLFFEQQLEQAKQNLANSEEALKETEQKTGVLEVDSQARALIESAAVLRSQIVAKEVQIQAMRTYATNENSNVVQTQQELDSLRAQLAKLGGSEDDSSAGLIPPKGKVTESGLEYLRKYRDVRYYEAIFEVLARQLELAKLDEAKEGSLIQVVDPAVAPDWKSSPKRALIILAAVFIGIFLGTLTALTGALLDRLRQDPETGSKLSALRRAAGRKNKSHAV